MDSVAGNRAPRRKSRRIKRKTAEKDPSFKPAKVPADSDSDYNSDPSTLTRRHNPPRSVTVTHDGSRINYSETKTEQPISRKRSSSFSSASGKRPKLTVNTKAGEGLSASTGQITPPEHLSEPAPNLPFTPEAKTVIEHEGKTAWFFTRVLQGVKNFWARSEVTTPSSPNNVSVEKASTGNSSKNNSNKETLAYDSNSAPAPTPKKGPVYYYNEAWHIPAEEIEILETISSGTFGDVARSRWRGSEVAVKTLRTQGPHVGEKVLNLFLKEVSILSKLRHPSIVLFMGASITPKLTIVMEYHAEGSLYNLLHVRKETIPYNQVIRMAREIAEGLNYLHMSTPKIIHRDVKSSNILVTTSKSVKIADFGISKETTAGSDSTMTGFMGTSSYMSPEMIRGTRYTESVDVYSYGVLLWEMYTHRIPFKSMHALQIAHKVLQGERPVIPDKCPEALAALLRSCWHELATERPNFKQIVQTLNRL